MILGLVILALFALCGLAMLYDLDCLAEELEAEEDAP